MVQVAKNPWKGGITPIVEEDTAAHQREGGAVVAAAFDDPDYRNAVEGRAARRSASPAAS